MSKIKKENLGAHILAELSKGTGVVNIMKMFKVSHKKVVSVREEFIDQIPVKDGAKVHIGGRFDGALTKKVLAECERLDINKNDFLEMVAEFYFKNNKR